jgi:hypothetical protein
MFSQSFGIDSVNEKQPRSWIHPIFTPTFIQSKKKDKALSNSSSSNILDDSHPQSYHHLQALYLLKMQKTFDLLS